ncbi:MAG: hypothetical protein KAW56_10015 [Candidatus Marinimicrobia bacterium]|nr:hypothetical protein [Candidatus Neomarinimicrobiota bacterium]
MNKEKWERIANNIRDRNPYKAAQIYQYVGDYSESGDCYEIAAMRQRDDNKNESAKKCYIKAGELFKKAGRSDESFKMQKLVADIDQYKGLVSQAEAQEKIAGSIEVMGTKFVDSAKIKADAQRESAKLLASTIYNAVSVISKNIRESAIIQATAILNGMKELSLEMKEGFNHLADSLFQGFSQLSEAQKFSALKIADSLLTGFENLSLAEQKSAMVKSAASLMGAKELSNSQKKIASEIAEFTQTHGEGFKQIGNVFYHGLNNIATSEAMISSSLSEIANRGGDISRALSDLGENNLRGMQMLQWSLWGRRTSRGLLAGLGHYITNDFFRPGIMGAIEKK